MRTGSIPLVAVLIVCFGLSTECKSQDEVKRVDVKTVEVQITAPRGAKLDARLEGPADASAPLPAVVLGYNIKDVMLYQMSGASPAPDTTSWTLDGPSRGLPGVRGQKP